jgi:putative nucleotidyltransferase with HDIG domain
MAKDKEEIDALLKRIREIPSLPAAVQRLCALLNDSDSDMKDVSRVISTDPALTAKLLKLANSSFYGLTRKVGTISQAVVVLGFSGVRNLALGVSLFEFRSDPHRKLPLDLEAFWRHSLAVATTARLLAPHVRLQDLEEAFVSGLLHDIGKIVLMEHFQETYAEVLKASGEGTRLFAAERAAFGIDHAEVGRRLCEHWKIPLSLTRAIAEHYPVGDAGSETGKDPLVHVVWLSDNLTKLMSYGFDGDPNVDPDFLAVLGSGGALTGHLRQSLLKLPAELEKAKIFFDLREMSVGPEPHAWEPCRISVRIQDARMRELIHLTVLGLGHAPSAGGPGDLLVSAVVSDGPAPLAMEGIPPGPRIPHLDFRQWLSRNGNRDGSVNTSKLRRWLLESLPDHAEGPSP